MCLQIDVRLCVRLMSLINKPSACISDRPIGAHLNVLHLNNLHILSNVGKKNRMVHCEVKASVKVSVKVKMAFLFLNHHAFAGLGV